jgi:hypothetical protein
MTDLHILYYHAHNGDASTKNYKTICYKTLKRHYFHQNSISAVGSHSPMGSAGPFWPLAVWYWGSQPTTLHRCQASESWSFICMPPFSVHVFRPTLKENKLFRVVAKVAGSIPDGVTGFFHWYNPSGRTMALGSTQPLTEMITRNIFWG